MGWEPTASYQWHHMGDVVSPDRESFVEVKLDQMAATTGNICLEMADIAKTFTEYGSPFGLLTDEPGTVMCALATGVRKTSYLSMRYAKTIAYVYFTSEAMDQGFVYSSHDAMRYALGQPSRWRTWSSASNPARDPMNMATTGVLVPVSEVASFAMAFTTETLLEAITGVLEASGPMTADEFARYPLKASYFPQHWWQAGKRIEAGVIRLPGSKTGKNPYPELDTLSMDVRV